MLTNMELQMKQLVAIFAIAFFATNSTAQEWADPMARFDAKKNQHETVRLTWIYADNVNQACDRESRRRGFGGYGFSVEACSFWDNNVCTIITKKRPNGHELGHEVRHCFQGNYH
jgi:hypothetical protein